MGELASSMPTRCPFQSPCLTCSGGLYWWTHHLADPSFRRCLCFVVGYLNTLGIVGGLCSINWGGALMLTSAVSISKDGNWTASTGQVYAVFLAIHVLQGFLAPARGDGDAFERGRVAGVLGVFRRAGFVRGRIGRGIGVRGAGQRQQDGDGETQAVRCHGSPRFVFRWPVFRDAGEPSAPSRR